MKKFAIKLSNNGYSDNYNSAVMDFLTCMISSFIFDGFDNKGSWICEMSQADAAVLRQLLPGDIWKEIEDF